MSETEKNNNVDGKNTNEIENNLRKLATDLTRLAKNGLTQIPAFLGVIIPLSLIGTGGALLAFGGFVGIFIREGLFSATSIMAGLIFLFFGVFGLAKQSHALFLKMLEKGKETPQTR